MPPEGIDVLIDREFTQIQRLLGPNRRRRPEAREKIRTLLAMEAHAVRMTSRLANEMLIVWKQEFELAWLEMLSSLGLTP